MIDTAKEATRLTQAHVNRMQIAGTTPTSTQIAAIKALVLGISSIGLSKFDAIYPMIGGTAATHALELIGSKDITWSGTVTHSASGSASDGSTGYGTLDFDATLLPANWHMGAYLNTAATAGAQMLGWQSSFSTTNVRSILAGTAVHQVYNGSWGATLDRVSVATDGLGLIVGVRNSNTDLRLYKAGAQSGSTYATAQTTSASSGDAQTMKLNGASGYCASRVAFLSIGDNLSDAEVSDLNDVVTAYQTTLARA